MLTYLTFYFIQHILGYNYFDCKNHIYLYLFFVCYSECMCDRYVSDIHRIECWSRNNISFIIGGWVCCGRWWRWETWSKSANAPTHRAPQTRIPITSTYKTTQKACNRTLCALRLQRRECVKWCVFVCWVSIYRIYLFIISNDIFDICTLSEIWDRCDWLNGEQRSASGSSNQFGAGRSPAYMQRLDIFSPSLHETGTFFCASA